MVVASCWVARLWSGPLGGCAVGAVGLTHAAVHVVRKTPAVSRKGDIVARFPVLFIRRWGIWVLPVGVCLPLTGRQVGL